MTKYYKFNSLKIYYYLFTVTQSKKKYKINNVVYSSIFSKIKTNLNIKLVYPSMINFLFL